MVGIGAVDEVDEAAVVIELRMILTHTVVYTR